MVGVVCVLVVGAIWARLIQVQFFDHSKYEQVGVKQREARRSTPPVRGGVFDRNGRPLALSASLCSVSISPARIESRRSVEKALARRLGVSRSEVRSKIRSRKQFVWIKRQCALDPEIAAELAAMAGVTVHREAGRVYPYDGVASKVVGFVGYDNEGGAGVEAAFNSELVGMPGEEILVRNGAYKTDRYLRRVIKAPTNGSHVYLTLDVVMQEIAEDELRRAVNEHEARSGSLIITDVRTGDILALAEYPTVKNRTKGARADSLWTLRSAAHVYEPGSTFKVVTAAALLETRSVAPADTFDAENGRAKLGYAVINDPHPHGVLTLEEGFAYSSNIVMAKAASKLDPEDFYEFIRLFGFGEKTGIRLLGESSGSVPAVEDWSARTQTTLAFGQEIAVTPLQMLFAVAAIANDGEMMMPRIVRGVADADGGGIRRYDPVRVRRVVSKRTAQTLRGFCRNVVDWGTGTKASVGFMEVSGKTGTAQKASPRGGYQPGKVVSSFIGFAPHEQPRIACLVLLDEPKWSSRYGGDSCAPTFARVCRALSNATDVFDDVIVERVVDAREHSKGTVAVPNFLRMGREAALERAKDIGCNVLAQGDDGRVIAQDPAPGVVTDKDALIRLYVSAGKRSPHAPDLRGLDMHEARFMAARHGYRTRFVGSGHVVRQKETRGPSGTRAIQLYCESSTSLSASGSR